MDDFLREMIASGSILAFPAALLGGMLTALNPCVLISVPLIVGLVGGQKEMTTAKALLYTSVFVFGFCLELVLLFTIMAGLAPYLKGAGMNYITGAICIFLGLFFLEVVQIPGLVTQAQMPKAVGLVGALIFGFMYGLISLPCTGPALLLILSLIPVKGAAFGGSLLLCYGLGNCALLIVAGTSIGAVRWFTASHQAQQATSIIKKIAAVLIISMGLYFIYRA
ncbi:MAG: hypothetical protein N3A66_02565 [Planctomycetota bacterium]|nr:hypothetical protein [Planctomycetota bacterium]